jgi:UDP-N-acetyl-D-mannosaminuronate dehydrogenase
LKKDIVAGLGEIGFPIYEIISKVFPVQGYDINSDLIPKTSSKLELYSTRFLHICIPYNKNFISSVLKLNKKFLPTTIVIHSTIKPGTTRDIQKKLPIPVIYSATRGTHKIMLSDLKRYTKFFALDETIPNSKLSSRLYAQLMKKCGIKTKKLSNAITLELSKIICDTSYYGWLINYAQMSKIIADKFSVDYDEMWSFADEIHKFLGNRPKLFPDFIGGHCVIPNLELLNDNSLSQINKINNIFKKFLDTKTL